MQLPEMKHPVYFTTLPSTGQQVKFRPFLVKEEKIMLLAAQEKDNPEVATEAIKNVISNCTFGQLDVSKLPVFDVEWIFLQLRIKSKGSEVKLVYTCQNIPEGQTEPCGQDITLKINLEELKVEKKENHTKKLLLSDDIGVVMRYPTIQDSSDIAQLSDDVAVFATIARLIETIFQGEKVIDTVDISTEQMVEWLENLTEDQMKLIQEFFDSMPKIRKTIKIVCPKCGAEEELTLEGLQSFLF